MVNIVVNSKFNPFSFDEIAKPYLLYKQEYDAQQAALGELASKASIWEGMANETNDPVAYARYKAFSDNLNNQMEQLATRGLSGGTKQALMNLKSDYSKRITPIEQAYARRKELSDEQRKMIAANPTMLFQRFANNMSLDDFIENPTADYGASYSGAMLTKQVSDAAARIATEARDSKNGRGTLRKFGLEGQYEYIKQNGYSRDAVMKAILNSPQADKILTDLVDIAIASSGVNIWGDESTRARALDYAKQGLYSAIGKTQTQIVKDDAYFVRLQHRLAEQAKKKVKEEERASMLNLLINPQKMYSAQKVGDLKNNMKRFAQYFYKKNGKWMMNAKGMNEYYNKLPGKKTKINGVWIEAAPSNSAFRVFMDTLGAAKYMGKEKGKNWQPGNMGNLFASWISNSGVKYNALEQTEFRYDIAESQRSKATSDIIQALGDKKNVLWKADIDKNGLYKKGTETLSAKQIAEEGWTVVAQAYSPYGDVIYMQNKEGDTGRFITREGGSRKIISSNPTVSKRVADIMDAVGDFQNSYKNKKVNIGGKEFNLTDLDVADMPERYRNLLQQAYGVASNLYSENKTEAQTFKPQGF